MSARVLSQLATLGFILLGLLAFSARYYSRAAVREGMQDSLWQLTYNMDFEVDSPQAEVTIGLPTTSSAAVVEREEVTNIGLQGEEKVGSLTQNRTLVLTTQISGKYEATAEFEIRLQPRNAWEQQSQFVSLSSAARSRYIRKEDTLDTLSAGVRQVLQLIPRAEMTEGEHIQKLFEYCSNLKEGTKEEGLDDVGYALANHRATPLGKARALVTLCRAAKYPARLVAGFEMRQSSQASPHVWVEVFHGHKWVPFDPTYGKSQMMPYDIIPIYRNGEVLVGERGIKNLNVHYSVVRQSPPENLLKFEKQRPSQIFDLTRLPVEMHEVMSLMLLLPLGALITAVFRNIIGLRTLGTFAPALLAMSFIYAELYTGLVILVSVLTAGYFGRILLDRLHLLMVPRSSIILTTIILLIVFGVSLIDYVAPESGVRAVLLPLVILTTLIERFFVTTEEDGTAFAVQLVIGTAVVAACCYLILRWQYIGNILLTYPELHFFTIAAFVQIGRYNGYRLVELWRFRDMVK